MVNHKHTGQERMRELCSVAVLGEISPDDMLVLSAHLEVCSECQKLMKEFDELTRVDLSAAAAVRIDSQQFREIDPAHENRLLHSLIDRIEGTSTHFDTSTEMQSPQAVVIPPCPVPLGHRIRIFFRHLYPLAGWALSALLVVALIQGFTPKQPTPAKAPAAVVSDIPSTNISSLKAEADSWKDRALKAEKAGETVQHDEEALKVQLQALTHSLDEASAKYQQTLTEKQQIEGQLAAQEVRLHQETSALKAAQTSVDEERSDAANLRAQLAEVTAHLDQQRGEMAHLQEVAATVPARMPMNVSDENLYDGREVFGARDLHIVDVYDVDRSGKASRTYGRVYYVNKSLLLFYAFDLDHNSKLRRPVAFQAWGFRQPNSKTVESLGLFYLEDAKVDRWTLRVSDPRLLAHIDSLFVTVEPPGGSNEPRGRQLLFASLSGPPNHP